MHFVVGQNETETETRKDKELMEYNGGSSNDFERSGDYEEDDFDNDAAMNRDTKDQHREETAKSNVAPKEIDLQDRPISDDESQDEDIDHHSHGHSHSHSHDHGHPDNADDGGDDNEDDQQDRVERTERKTSGRGRRVATRGRGSRDTRKGSK